MFVKADLFNQLFGGGNLPLLLIYFCDSYLFMWRVTSRNNDSKNYDVTT